MSSPAADPFIHEGLFYRDAAEYVRDMTAFITTGLVLDEPVLVAVPGENLDLIRDAMGADASRVRFRDMSVAGRNPGRIIPGVLLAFVDEHAGRRVRIIGEPIWADRSDTEYPACVQHEALINVALAGHPATVLCPYDAVRLSPTVLADAEGTHPILVDGDTRYACAGYRSPLEIVDAYNVALPEPVGAVESLQFDAAGISSVRRLVNRLAAQVSLAAERTIAVTLAVHELAVNAVEHAGGTGRLRAWTENASLVYEVSDSGGLDDPLAGRRAAPTNAPHHERGLLMVQGLCDLVRVHTRPGSTSVRVYMHL